MLYGKIFLSTCGGFFKLLRYTHNKISSRVNYYDHVFTLLSIPPSQEYFIIVIGFLLWKYYELQQSVLYQAITLYSYPVVFVIKNIFSTTTHHRANVYSNKCVYVLICSVTKILKINCCFSICSRVIFSMAKCIDSISSILWDTYNLLHRLSFLFHSISLYDTFD